MSDIPRLDGRAAQLVRNARGARTGPSSSERDRVRKQVLLTAGASTALAHGTAQAAWLSSAKSAADTVVVWSIAHAKMIAVASVVSGSTIAGVMFSRPHNELPARSIAAVTQMPAEPTVAAIAPVPSEAHVPEPLDHLTTPSAIEAPPSAAIDEPTRRTPRLRSVSPAAEVVNSQQPSASLSVSRLAEESQLIAHADEALRSHRLHEAHALLAQHEHDFPSGALAAERRTLLLIVACSEAPPGARAHILEQASPQPMPGSPGFRRLMAICR